MAEIDYAFLADFAKIEPNGTLTAVGASWHWLQVDTFPTSHRLAVAGRVRAREAEVPVSIRITVIGPGDTYKLAAEVELRTTDARPYGDGRVGLLFVLDVQVPIPQPGLYEVQVELSDGGSRRLAFEAAAAEPAN